MKQILRPRVALSTVSARSLLSKRETFKHYLSEKAIDICAITESWIHADTTKE